MSFCTYKLPLPLNQSVHCKHNIYLEYNIIFKSLGFYNHRKLLFYILQPVFSPEKFATHFKFKLLWIWNRYKTWTSIKYRWESRYYCSVKQLNSWHGDCVTLSYNNKIVSKHCSLGNKNKHCALICPNWRINVTWLPAFLIL